MASTVRLMEGRDMEQVKDIATRKLSDTNATSLDGAINIVLGTARSMGVKIQK